MSGTHDDDKTLTSLEEPGSDSSSPPEGAADVLGSPGVAGATTAPVRRKRMSRSTLLMVVTVAISGAAIGGMRYLARGPRSSSAAVRIDYDIEKAKGGANDHKKVLAELATTQAAQVPPEQVQRNPFMMAGALEEMEVGGPPTDDTQARSEKAARAEAEKARKEAEDRQRSIETAFNELNLHSVMGGPTPVARISGQTVKVGDTVGNYFKVLTIQGRTVTLQADSQTFTLGMQAGASAPAPGKPAPRQGKPR